MTIALEQWLEARLEGTGPVQLGPLTKPGSGLSAGTLLFEAHRARSQSAGSQMEDASSDQTHELVVRIPPSADEALFPHGDLKRELETQNLLASAGLPVAPVVGLETDSSVLGRPFLVTRRVPGRLVDSSAPYLSAGWLHDSTPDFQLRVARGFFGVLAGIHSLQPGNARNLGLPAEQAGNEAALHRWSSYLAWADEQATPDALHEAFRWCRENRPSEEPAHSLLWGDAQLANAVFSDDGSTAAILDFELVALGPAELDLGWFFCLHDMTVARCGEDLPGFEDRAGLVAGYEKALGRQITDLTWYEVFAAVCTACILVRMSSLLCRSGLDARWLASSNPALDYLASKLS